MDLIKKYSFRVEHYDYFGGHKFETKVAETPLEIVKMHQNYKKGEFWYDDGSFYRVGEIHFRFEAISPSYGQRYHSRSKWEWEKIQKKPHFNFSPEEIEFLTMIWEDSDDDDIII